MNRAFDDFPSGVGVRRPSERGLPKLFLVLLSLAIFLMCLGGVFGNTRLDAGLSSFLVRVEDVGVRQHAGGLELLKLAKEANEAKATYTDTDIEKIVLECDFNRF